MWLRSIALFTMGVGVGWTLKTADVITPEHSTAISTQASTARQKQKQKPMPLSPAGQQSLSAAEVEQFTQLDSPREQSVARQPEVSLIALLEQGKYEQAILVLQNAEQTSASEFKQLNAVVLDFLTKLLNQDRANDFIDLTNLYLSSYYDDVDVLLLLAAFNKGADLYIEAVGVYQLATEYAYSLKSQQKVATAFDTFIRETDGYLSQREDWYNLGQVYFQAEIVGLLATKYHLRQAEVYITNGDHYEASQVLYRLRENDQYAQAANALLAKIEGGGRHVAKEGLSQNDSQGVELEKRGNQYIVELGLSGNTDVRLLIDTGASLTTLSQSVFSDIQSFVNYDYVGDRMFSTANGLVKGEVYNVDFVQIGGYALESTLIAVLDFGIHGDIGGLLGMNVLGQFRFQIDQDKKQLFLSPR